MMMDKTNELLEELLDMISRSNKILMMVNTIMYSIQKKHLQRNGTILLMDMMTPNLISILTKVQIHRVFDGLIVIIYF